MPTVTLPGVTIAYDVFGPDTGEPVVLVCGLSQPAVGWQLAMVPALTGAGYRVVTFDNRGVAPSSSPPAPYTIDNMVDDTVGLLEHLGLGAVHLVGYSMGGWIVETLAYQHPGRVRSGVFIGSCNVGTSWEKAITTVERDLARLQRDSTVDAWLAMIGNLEPWPNPGRLGQYEAALSWSLDVERTQHWPELSRPCLVLAFEHDVDSPPARAREAAGMIPGARFVELAGASHLGVFTHGDAVAAEVLGFLAEVGPPTDPPRP
jgi:pimeloyl-ACP methyl ester carboxylesterase